jgi:hypothetical protein
MTEPVDRPRTRFLRPLLEGAVVVLFLLLIGSNYTLRRQAHAAAITVSEHGFVARDVFPPAIPVVDLQGKPRTLDLRTARTTVAIVDPRCESCRELVATLRDASNVRVLSVAPLEETRRMAGQSGLAGATFTLGISPLPKRFASKLQIYPQLFIVDGGKVVRSCATLAECR